MPEGKKEIKPVCDFCGNTSHQKVVLQAWKDEKPVFVCTACLPRLIHGDR